MTEPTSDRVVKRIAGLFHQAENAKTPGEAEVYTTRAAELMIKYRVDEETLRQARNGRRPRTEPIVRNVLKFPGIYGKINMIQANAIVEALGDMRTVDASKLERGSTCAMWIIGYETDVRHASLLVASLQVQCAQALQVWWKMYNSRGLTAMQKFVDKRTFIDGFTYAAVERINRARGNVEGSVEPGTALALRERMSDVDTFMNSLGVETKNNTITMNLGARESRDAGRSAGLNSNTHDPGIRVSRRELTA